MLGEWISLAILLFFSLVGMFTLSNWLIDRCYETPQEGQLVTLYRMEGESDCVESHLRALLRNREGRVIVVDDGVGDNSRKVLERMSSEHPRLSMVAGNELPAYLERLRK